MLCLINVYSVNHVNNTNNIKQKQTIVYYTDNTWSTISADNCVATTGGKYKVQDYRRYCDQCNDAPSPTYFIHSNLECNISSCQYSEVTNKYYDATLQNPVCLSSCPAGYYSDVFGACNPSCATYSYEVKTGAQTLFCFATNSCPGYYILDLVANVDTNYYKQCVVDCPLVNPYRYNKECKKSCPSFTESTNGLKDCYATCQFSYVEVSDGQGGTIQQCVDSCPSTGTRPYGVPTSGKLKCVAACPPLAEKYIDTDGITCLSACTGDAAVSIDQTRCDLQCLFKMVGSVRTCVSTCPADEIFKILKENTVLTRYSRFMCTADCTTQTVDTTKKYIQSGSNLTCVAVSGSDSATEGYISLTVGTPTVTAGIYYQKCPSSTPYLDGSAALLFQSLKRCVSQCAASNAYEENGVCTATCSQSSYVNTTDPVQILTCVSYSCRSFYIVNTTDSQKQCVSACSGLNMYLDGMECKKSCPFYADSDLGLKICKASCLGFFEEVVDPTNPANKIRRCLLSCSMSLGGLKLVSIGNNCSASCSNAATYAVPDPRIYLDYDGITCTASCAVFSSVAKTSCNPTCWYYNDGTSNICTTTPKTCPNTKPFAQQIAFDIYLCVATCPVGQDFLFSAFNLTCIPGCTVAYVEVLVGAITGYVCQQSCPASTPFYSSALYQSLPKCVATCLPGFILGNSCKTLLSDCSTTNYQLVTVNTVNEKYCVSTCPQFKINRGSGTYQCVSSCSLPTGDAIQFIFIEGNECKQSCPMYYENGADKTCISLGCNLYYLVPDPLSASTIKNCSLQCQYVNGAQCVTSCSVYDVDQYTCVAGCSGDKVFRTSAKTQCDDQCWYYNDGTDNICVGTGASAFACPSNKPFKTLHPGSLTRYKCSASCSTFFVDSLQTMVCLLAAPVTGQYTVHTVSTVTVYVHHVSCPQSIPFSNFEPTQLYQTLPKCVAACSTSTYIYVDGYDCASTCANGFKLVNSNKLCTTCPGYYIASTPPECVDACPTSKPFRRAFECITQAQALADTVNCAFYTTVLPITPSSLYECQSACSYYEIQSIPTMKRCVPNCVLLSQKTVLTAPGVYKCVSSCASEPTYKYNDLDGTNCASSCVQYTFDLSSCAENCWFSQETVPVLGSVQQCVQTPLTCPAPKPYKKKTGLVFECLSSCTGLAGNEFVISATDLTCIQCAGPRPGYTVLGSGLQCQQVCPSDKMYSGPSTSYGVKECVSVCPDTDRYAEISLVCSTTCASGSYVNTTAVQILTCTEIACKGYYITNTTSNLKQCVEQCNGDYNFISAADGKECLRTCPQFIQGQISNVCINLVDCNSYIEVLDYNSATIKKCVNFCPQYSLDGKCVSTCLGTAKQFLSDDGFSCTLNCPDGVWLNGTENQCNSNCWYYMSGSQKTCVDQSNPLNYNCKPTMRMKIQRTARIQCVADCGANTGADAALIFSDINQFCVDCPSATAGYIPHTFSGVTVNQNICYYSCPDSKPYIDKDNVLSGTVYLCVDTCPNSKRYAETDMSCTAICASSSYVNNVSNSQILFCTAITCQSYYITNLTQKECVSMCIPGKMFVKNFECIAQNAALCPYFTQLSNGLKICEVSCNIYYIPGVVVECVTACPLAKPYIANNKCIADCTTEPILKYLSVGQVYCIDYCAGEAALDQLTSQCNLTCQYYIDASSSPPNLKICIQTCNAAKPFILIGKNNRNQCVESCPIGWFSNNLLVCQEFCQGDTSGYIKQIQSNTQTAYICLSICPAYRDTTAANLYPALTDGLLQVPLCVSTCPVGYVSEKYNTCQQACNGAPTFGAISINNLDCNDTCYFYTNTSSIKKCLVNDLCVPAYPFYQQFFEGRHECVTNCNVTNIFVNESRHCTDVCTVGGWSTVIIDLISVKVCFKKCPANASYLLDDSVVTGAKHCVPDCGLLFISVDKTSCVATCPLLCGNQCVSSCAECINPFANTTSGLCVDECSIFQDPKTHSCVDACEHFTNKTCVYTCAEGLQMWNNSCVPDDCILDSDGFCDEERAFAPSTVKVSLNTNQMIATIVIGLIIIISIAGLGWILLNHLKHKVKVSSQDVIVNDLNIWKKVDTLKLGAVPETNIKKNLPVIGGIKKTYIEPQLSSERIFSRAKSAKEEINQKEQSPNIANLALSQTAKSQIKSQPGKLIINLSEEKSEFIDENNDLRLDL
ncbi:Conserved_hypothetical protein [Hexamita inflata]|uniref:Uncharacterized protein n=1 Tax=Hexamita inflata TaxID=28002 RepID=A0AA86PQK0_9EUKA|nr:Conserved hypothetical protein [Hexamita inflata]